MKTNGNDSAMPYVVPGSVEDRYVEKGLTVREHFAAMAMQGILASWNRDSMPQTLGIKVAVERATEIADALITELNKNQ